MRLIFHISTLLLVFNPLYSQDEPRKRNNLLFLELMGAAEEGAGIGYERYFQLSRLFRYSVRSGLSYNLEYKHVPLFLGNSLMFGKRHNVEVGLNFMAKYADTYYVDNPEFNPEKEIGHGNDPSMEIVLRRNIFNGLLGYRYQNEKSGFMVRTFIGTPIEQNEKFSVGPHIGASLGLSF